jgi:hypothetical protein
MARTASSPSRIAARAAPIFSPDMSDFRVHAFWMYFFLGNFATGHRDYVYLAQGHRESEALGKDIP